MGVDAFAFQLVPFVLQDQHGVELVGPDIVKADVDAEIERRAQVESAPDEDSGFRSLRGVQSVERAVIATATFGRVRTQAGIAQLLAPEGPVDEVAEGRIFRPLRR